jgi:hypothetical protein
LVPDPTRPDSHNRYSYVNNSPLKLVDPSGHYECLDWDSNGACIERSQYRPRLVRTKVFSDQDLTYIAITLLAENSWGTHSPEAMTMMAWVWFNRSPEGGLFSSVDAGGECTDANGTIFRCGAWYSMIESFLLPDGLTYQSATPEEREAALNKAIERYATSDSARGAAYQRVLALVKDAYARYHYGGPDPTNGAVQYAHQRPEKRGLHNGQELYDLLSQNFAYYQSLNPDFRYALSQPYVAPYPDGSQWYVLVVGDWTPCVVYGSCGATR